MLDQNLNWKDAENIKKRWNGIFCLKGIMSREDALKAVDIGADAIMISNKWWKTTRWIQISF